MILEEITIRNVGLFRGSHTLPLAPPAPDESGEKPIILIGGLNGSGKTTLLDAIQLALYGKRARLSNRGNLSYEEYLRRSVNNQAQSEEASVTLAFRQVTDGRENSYQIRRGWQRAGESVNEFFAVNRNGAFDRVVTETWAEVVEEILPIEIAGLFFFDGEKIESFANLESSAALLEKAVHSLLGLDVVNRLTADLIALERRKQITLKSDVERQKIIALETEIKTLEMRRGELVETRAARQNDFDRRRKDSREAQTEYEKRGGSLFDQREELERELDDLQKNLRATEDELRGVADEDAPLLLISDLLAAIGEQHERETAWSKFAVVNEVLATRDASLLATINQFDIQDAAITGIEHFLAADRLKRAQANAETEVYLHLSPEATGDLYSLQTAVLPQTEKRLTELLNSADEWGEKTVHVERKLAGVPAQDLVIELIKRRDQANAAVVAAENRLAEIDADLKRIGDELEQKQTALNTLFEKNVVEQFQAEDAERVVLHSQKARRSVDEFRRRLVASHAHRIAALVLDSFRQLLRKESLISDLSIDAGNFTITLRDQTGKLLLPDRLSAGERQLLAVSLLWGLARASGRPLPVVVDTPLGRLDTVHRRRMVENYFPNASHQVLLLSTDEEIDQSLFERLKPFVGRAYRFEFDEQTGSSQIRAGYFW